MFFLPAPRSRASDERSRPAARVGSVPPADRFQLGTLVRGAPLAPQGRDQIVLGETSARILDAQPGSVVTLMAVLPDGALNGRDFTVQAVYRDPGRDKVFAFTDYDSAVSFTGIARRRR